VEGAVTHRVGGGVEAVPVLRNADPAVLEAVRGSYKLLVGRHLPTVLEWLAVAVKVPPPSLLHDPHCSTFTGSAAGRGV